MELIVKFVVDRMKERSTWIGLVGLMSSVGIALEPSMVEAIASVGVALSAVVMILTKDIGKKPVEGSDEAAK